MTAINIQLQPHRSPLLDVGLSVDRLASFDASAEVSSGNDNGTYINIDFVSADAITLWLAIREQLSVNSDLASATMVVCEGQHGWDDYLLLHHFDPAEPLDDFD